MEIIAEVVPSRNKTAFLQKLSSLKSLVDRVDIPEAPCGRPIAHSIAACALAKQMGLEPILHLRLADLNKTGFKSLLGGAQLLEIKYVVLLQGDPPAEGRPVGEVTTEEAVAEAKKMGFMTGAILSLRRDYRKRLETLGADFYLALHATSAWQLADLNAAIYPYVIIATEKNTALLERLGHAAFKPREAAEFVRGLEGLVPGVIISAPGDFPALLQFLKDARSFRS
jgi:5,10-methylenetetrahydrofolate reductase